MRTVPAAWALGVVLAGLSGCGDAPERAVAPEVNSARVALTVDYPGSAPLALITYRAAGRRCHALGRLTASGARALAEPGAPLDGALERRGVCLDGAAEPVSVELSAEGSGPLRAAGGLARRDVVRIRVAGQRARPGRDGAFLVAWPSDAGDAGSIVEVTLRDGSRQRVPLQPPAA